MTNTRVRKRSHIDERREEVWMSKLMVCALTGISHEEHNLMQFEEGFRFLEMTAAGDDASVYQVSTRELFWKWWRNSWAMRDQQYLQTNWNTLSEIHAFTAYVKEHDGRELATGDTYWGGLLCDGYAAMVSLLNGYFCP